MFRPSPLGKRIFATMECVAPHDPMTLWLLEYGSIALFVLLTLGIVAFPVPEETLMVIAGILMSKGSLNIVPTCVAAYCGSICGITMSYVLGRTLGYYLLHHYGGWIGITEERTQQAHAWFEHYGKWSLAIGYFIPGVRHFTGFSAGTTSLDLHQFALFAYGGAAIWVTTFLSIGYFFGDYCQALYESLEVDLNVVITVAVIAAVVWIIYRFRKKK